tara:strand:+ start:43 stop:519 length:477 start_codon:yes stop_codon:yes gene_type:complete
MGGNSSSKGGGQSPANKYQTPPPPKKKPIPLVGIILDGLARQKKAADQNMLDYEGEAAGVTRRRSNAQAMRERREERESGSFEGNSGKTTSNINISTAPTVAEVSQSNAANASTPVEEDPLYLRKKKAKAKGRSATILTSAKGVDEGLTLGKTSLLGS